MLKRSRLGACSSSVIFACLFLVVGVMMMSSFKDIDWGDFDEAVPAFFAGVDLRNKYL